MSDTNKYDLIIVGGGPAGLTAAIYAARRKMHTLVIAKSLGGQAAITNEIENYPGFELISGPELMDKMHKQAAKWGVEFVSNEVNKIEKIGDDFVASTNKEKYAGQAVILAFGLTPRDLDVPGEETFKGRGVTYCATCDGPLYKNKTIAVIGGGNSAVESAEYMSKIATKVYLVHFTEKFHAEQALVEKVKQISNVEMLCCQKIIEVKGDKKVEGIVLTDTEDGQKIREVAVDGVFVEIGYRAKTDWLSGLLELNDRKEVVINHDNQTSVPGIFAAGDCSDTSSKQIVIAAGEGAKAALKAYKYVNSDKKVVAPDWGHK